MKIIINANAHRNASLGSKRYFEGVFKCLSKSQTQLSFGKEVHFGILNRLLELFQLGSSDSIFWSPCHRGPIWAKNHVITVLDCINIEYTYKHDWRLSVYKFIFRQIYKRALKIVAISNATKEAIIRNYDIDPSKIVVIAGPSRISMKKDLLFEIGPITNQIKKPFILLIANCTYHKNTYNGCLGVIKSKAFQDKNYALVVVGSVDKRILSEFSNEPNLHIFDKVSDSYLNYLYDNCTFLFSPSFDEGLNMPIAEALSLNVKVLCSDIPVHREFYSGFVEFFDPYNISEISEKVDQLANKNEVIPRKPNGFVGIDFEIVAYKYSELFEKISVELGA